MNIKIFIFFFWAFFKLPAFGMVDFIFNVNPRQSYLAKQAKVATQTNRLEKLLSKAEIQKKLDDFCKTSTKVDDTIIPGFFVKKGVNRIDGAQLFLKKINDLGYEDIRVAQEAAFTTHENNSVVISCAVTPCTEKITRTQAEHMYTLAVALRWADVHAGNFIKTAPNMITILDMEPTLLPLNMSEENICGSIATSMLLHTAQECPYNDEALAFIRQEQTKHFPFIQQKF